MQSSGISSRATPSNRPQSEPARKHFALTGRSCPIDSRTEAVRPDLADIRLADRVFAPHYAAPMPRVVRQPVALRAASAGHAEVLTMLDSGDVFEVLEFAGSNAWGVAPGHRLVGYIDSAALAEA